MHVKGKTKHKTLQNSSITKHMCDIKNSAKQNNKNNIKSLLVYFFFFALTSLHPA